MFLFLFQGTLSGQRQRQPVFICKLEVSFCLLDELSVTPTIITPLTLPTQMTFAHYYAHLKLTVSERKKDHKNP
jgi:hypothetical protein